MSEVVKEGFSDGSRGYHKSVLKVSSIVGKCLNLLSSVLAFADFNFIKAIQQNDQSPGLELRFQVVLRFRESIVFKDGWEVRTKVSSLALHIVRQGNQNGNLLYILIFSALIRKVLHKRSLSRPWTTDNCYSVAVILRIVQDFVYLNSFLFEHLHSGSGSTLFPNRIRRIKRMNGFWIYVFFFADLDRYIIPLQVHSLTDELLRQSTFLELSLERFLVLL